MSVNYEKFFFLFFEASCIVWMLRRGHTDLQQDLIERLDISFVNFTDEFGISFEHVVQRLDQLVLCQWLGSNIRLRWSRQDGLLFDSCSLEHSWSDQC